MEHMVRRVEPPIPWDVVQGLRAMADDSLVVFAVGAWAKEGLGVLADHYQERGMVTLADFWRSKVRDLGEVNIAGLDLALTVGDGLKDLADLYREAGYPLLAMRWGLWSTFIQDRAWMRERARLGIDR